MKHLLAAMAMVAGLFAAGNAAADAIEAQAIVDKAKATISTLAADPNLPLFKDYAGDAKGILIVPTLVKGGFIIGGSGGSGVLMVRLDDGQSFSQPAFYTMGSVTIGLQIGGEVSEIALLLMTDDAVDSFLTTSAKLGGDVSIAAGPVGIGAKAQIVDVLAFSRTQGLYGGLNLEGAVVDVRDEWNRDYYGRKVRPRDILVRQAVMNENAAALRRAVAKAAAPHTE